jgi:hypothetical protein
LSVAWIVEDFLHQVLASLHEQGYRIDALLDPRPLGIEGGAWRVGLRSPEEAMPSSVIIKQVDDERPWRWDDWACQYFLSDLAGTRGLGPEFFAGDERLGFYMLQDLGLGQDLGTVLLLEDGRGRLAAGLLSCALAGLHAGTWGRERPYALLRERLGGQAPQREEELALWRSRVEEALLALGPIPDLAAALDLIQGELADPKEFLVLTHGDWSARSLWYGDLGPRFLDFRLGAFRHGLLDLAAWEARCAANEATAEVLWREYREEWTRLGADRGERFLPALACARAFIALEHLARGERLPFMRGFLNVAGQEAGLEALQGLAQAL